MEEYKVAVVGAGAWGKNLLQTIDTLCNVFFVGYGGSDGTKLFLETNYPQVNLTTNLVDIAQNPLVKSVFIATPISFHYEHAKFFLENKKHVFVEKPLSISVEEINKLYSIAEAKNTVLFTGYIYLYDPALAKLKEIIGNQKTDISFVWEKWGTFGTPLTTNLLVHELALAAHLLGELKSIAVMVKSKDRLVLKTSHTNGTTTISINRRSQSKQKTITAVTEDYTVYKLQNSQLIKGECEVIFKATKETTLSRECRTFIAETQGLNKNMERKKIDIAIAQALEEINKS